MNERIQAQVKPTQKSSFAPSTPRLLQRKCACGGAAGLSGKCEECSKEKRFGLQTKLKVNKPGDSYEREADQIADQVMSTPLNSTVGGAPPRTQRSSGQSNGHVDEAPASVDEALASPGRPLEPPLRQDMEQRFGHDFSRVRVHSGTAAEQSAQDVNAHAYTVGHNIVFGAGQPAPRSREGRRLLAHELTHVVQQRAGHAHGIQREAKASEVLPRKAKVIKLGGLRYQYDFGRPITKEQAAQVLFRDGKVPEEATLVQGPGNNSWTLQTFDIEEQQATVNKMRARTETVSRWILTEPLVSGQWKPPPPDEITVEWTEGPSKPRTGPKREDLKNEFGFTIIKKYYLDQGQRPSRQVGQLGMGYEVLFEKSTTKAEVMNKLFDKSKITQGEVILLPLGPEPTPLWKVEVLGVDAATAWKPRVGRAFQDASVYQEASIPSGTPVGVRAHLENKTVPKDAVNPLPNVYVWEQEGYMVYVETNNKGKDGYYEPQFTKMPDDKEGKIWMRYYMQDKGMPPRQAWQNFRKDTIEIYGGLLGMVLGAVRAPRMLRPRPPVSDIGPPTTKVSPTPDPVLPVKPPKVSPTPKPVLTVNQGGSKGSGNPTGMLRDTDSASKGVQLPASHTVFKNKLPANDPPTPPPQAQAAKVAVNATKDLPHGQNIDPAQGLSARNQNADPIRMGKKLRTTDPNKLEKKREAARAPAAELDPGEGATTKKTRKTRGADDDLPKKEKISDRYDKPELEDSPELIARLPKPEERRRYMEWLKKSHDVPGHGHINPTNAAQLDASLREFEAETGIKITPVP